jgi:pimeloyl-ACP methyl ester carboxylesterase
MAVSTSAAHVASLSRRIPRWRLVLPFLPLLMLALLPPIFHHVRAASVLMEIGGLPEPRLLQIDTNPVVEEVVEFPSSAESPARARIFHPVGIATPSALVIVPGVHHLGMEEPRLRRFAGALAAHGYLVMTPQVDAMADYRITHDSAVVIGDAVHELARRSGAKKVGLLGLSFAGGMALIAASDPAVEKQLSCVIAVGAHDDLRRVLDFFETDQTRAPDGSVLQMKAHEYGSLVTAYSHIDNYFSPQDVPQARLTLRTLLWEEVPLAHAEAAKLSPAGQARMAQLFAHDTHSLVADTHRALAAAMPELDAASPDHYIQRVHVPVMLLHGSADNVVPPTETLWLEHDLPPGVLKSALISPAIGHVEIGGASVMDQLRLVHWMEEMLELLDGSRAERG